MTVGILGIATAMLVLTNLAGVTFLGPGRYDPAVSGSLAEWCGALATLVAVPLALVAAARQVSVAAEQNDLTRQTMEVEGLERAERRARQLAEARAGLVLAVDLLAVQEVPDLADQREAQAIVAWREEMANRGWTSEGDAWKRNGESRTTGELAASAPTSLLTDPIVLVLELVNRGLQPLTVVSTVFVHPGGEMVQLAVPTVLRSGETARARVPGADGRPLRFASKDGARSASEVSSVVATVRDVHGDVLVIEEPVARTGEDR